MKARLVASIALAAVCVLLPGCGSKEQDTRERERMELEERSRREAETANKAITDLNRKRFGRKPATTPAETPAGDQPKPEEKQPSAEPQKH